MKVSGKKSTVVYINEDKKERRWDFCGCESGEVK